MKKTIVASVLGLIASVAMVGKAQAQGFVVFANYANGGALASPVTFSGPAFGGLVNGEAVGTGFTATLLYSYGANLGVTYTDAGVTASFLAASGDVANGAGLFGSTANSVTIPGYTSGTVDFMVQVFNGSGYSSQNTTIHGQSGVVTLTTLATAANLLPTKT